jgi:hypothetical protein
MAGYSNTVSRKMAPSKSGKQSNMPVVNHITHPISNTLLEEGKKMPNFGGLRTHRLP